jgi:type VI secretion system protein ImpL
MSSLGANRRLLDGSRLALSKSASIRSYADAYRRFGGIGSVTTTLQGYKDNGVPPVIGGGIYRGGKVLEELRPEFIALSQKLILKPAVKYLEYSINGLCDQTGELSGEQHLALYRALKACLSLSEAVAQRTELIDTVFLRDALVEAVTQSLLRAEGQSRLPVDIEAVLHQNLGLMLAYHKRGGFPLIQENQSMVTYARRRLQRLPDATTLYELVAGRITKDAPRIKLSDIIGSADETILQSELTISAIYTKEGWERYVRDAIAEAAKDPFKVDWVIGVNPDAVSAALPEPTKLRADMNEAYFTDYTRRWLAFINAVTMEPFGDLGRSGRILKKLTSDQSELVLLLKTVSDYTAIDISSGTADAGEKALAAASKLKATSALAKKAGKMQNTADIIGDNFGLPHRSGGDYLKRTFDPLRSFIQSTGGALGGYEGYRDKIQTLAEKLADIEERGDDHAVIVFNGGDSDPLLSSWKLTQNVISGMPEDLGEACGNLLLLPLRHTGISASAVLTEKLNARWQEEVVKQFTSRFASNFPIKSSVSEEASFNDVMEFFRPNTGTLWGFYDRVLEPFIIKSGGNWTVITVGSLDINFNPEITKSLENADRIREIFYKTDGTVRTLSITLTPLPRNKFRAAIEVNGQTAELKPGGASAQIRWPVDAPSQGAVLKAFVSDDFTQELSFKGRWGLMRLIQKAKISVLNKSTFDATWEMNVQNMYMAYLTVRIQVSGNDHPFGEPVFSQFDCPVNLTIHGVPKVEPQE